MIKGLMRMDFISPMEFKSDCVFIGYNVANLNIYWSLKMNEIFNDFKFEWKIVAADLSKVELLINMQVMP